MARVFDVVPAFYYFVVVDVSGVTGIGVGVGAGAVAGVG